MPALPKIIGIARAMEKTGFVYYKLLIRRDGKLIDGTTIHEAIKCIYNKMNTVCW